MTSPMHKIALVLFVLALLHTFATRLFDALAHDYPRHAGLFHLLGEVEVVFGFWAFVLIVAMAFVEGGPAAIGYAESRQYTEPLFVFVVMVVAASRPMLETARTCAPARAAAAAAPRTCANLARPRVRAAGRLAGHGADAMTIAPQVLALSVFC